MPQYEERFQIGSAVNVVDRERLQAFYNGWRLHHPLGAEQLASAGRRALVKGVSFYHGGDPLYELEGLPGVWHEACLEAAE